MLKAIWIIWRMVTQLTANVRCEVCFQSVNFQHKAASRCEAICSLSVIR